MRHRICEVAPGYYAVETRFLCFWFRTGRSHLSVEDAEEYLKEIHRIQKHKKRVVKEIEL